MAAQKEAFDRGGLFRALPCAFFGALLYLFIRNNHLFIYGRRILHDVTALIILAILSLAFLLSLLHFVRGLRQQPLESPD